MQERLKILVVDDEQHLRRLMATILSRNGYEIIEADSGRAVLEAMAEARPNLVLLDIMLPDLNGVELCRRIKSDPRYVDVLVCLISAWQVSPEFQAAGLGAGADGYIARPVETCEFLARVDSLARLARTQAALRAAHRELEHRAAEAKFDLEHIYRDAPIGLAVLDGDLRYVRVNERLAELNGQPIEGHLGRTIHEVIPDLAAQEQSICRHVLESGESVLNVEISAETQAAPGRRRHWLVSHYPLKDPDGGVCGVSVIVQEISERKETERALSDQLRFEQLLLAISARFVNVSGDQVDNEIIAGLARVRDFFGIDGAGLIELLPRETSARLTHVAPGEGTLPIPSGIDITALFPWGYEKAGRRGEPLVFSRLDDLSPEAAVDRRTFEEWEIRSGLTVPIVAASSTRYFLSMASDQPGREWPEAYIPQLQLLGKVFADALEHQRAESLLKQSYEEIQALKERLQAETNYLRDEVKLSHRFEDIVGQSEAIRRVLADVQRVAPTDSPVLIQGETGTGKELVAQAIHNLSGRRDRVLVKVNCASLPATLIESELFGREKGAFTGALTKQIGRFELADGSTIFLDEIGELPPEMQAKLLRVLQSGEFERLGSPRTIRVNVRVIAAANRDLVREVRQGRFRQDLYYRLNVFPIVVPPLRERREDIPLLTWAFLDELQKRMGKKIRGVPKRVMESLVRYAWPGNVRELRNVVERGVIISAGDTLMIELPDDGPGEPSGSLTLEEVERRHILLVLERTAGRIKGPDGAAKILGLNPSTLYTRMQKLGLFNGQKKDGIPS